MAKCAENKLETQPSDEVRRVRILFLDGCYDGTVGGSHSCVYTLIMNLNREKFDSVAAFYSEHIFSRKLQDAGIETHILKWYAPRDFLFSKEAKSHAINIIRAPLVLARKAMNFWLAFLRPAIRHAIFIRKKRIDIVHLNNSVNTNHDWMLGAKIARVRLVSHERGMSRRLTRTARLMAMLVDRFVCVSNMIRENLQRESLPENKLALVYDGIDFRRFVVGRPSQEVRRQIGVGDNQPVIGILGNVREWKGQETVIRATALLKARWPNVVCLIVGHIDANDSYARRLYSLVSELGLENSVRFMGFQDQPGEFLGMMDVVCHASIRPEPFGMVNLEAMYMGKPVVSTNVGGPVEVFTHGVNGLLIQPGDAKSLAEAVAALLADSALAKRLGEAAHRHLMTHFSATSTALEMEAIYDELVSQR